MVSLSQMRYCLFRIAQSDGSQTVRFLRIWSNYRLIKMKAVRLCNSCVSGLTIV